MNLDEVIDDLFYKYNSGNLIPVLGAELFKIEIGSDEQINIHEYIIKKFFHPTSEWPEAPKLLSELELASSKFDYNNLLGIYNLLHDRQKKLKFLNVIANLKHFKVFLIASVFKEFEREFKKSNDEEIEIYKNDAISPHGLQSINFNNGKRKIIYLFDNLDSRLCAINDDQLLESMYSLANSPKNNPDNSLLSYLQDKILLFIGCDFPDWFMRYCIRVLSNNPFSKKPTYIVNDHPPKLKYQEFFFAKHNIQLIQTSPVDDFINKFQNKALEAEEDFTNKYQNSQIFISYGKKYDLNIAKKLYKNFRHKGVEAYFDEETMIIGGHQEEIIKYIRDPKTKVLLSVVSKQLIESMENNESNYIRDVEWGSAELRNKYFADFNSNQKISIVPYFVDNEKDYVDRLPTPIRSEFRFGEFHGGFEKLFDETKKVLA